MRIVAAIVGIIFIVGILQDSFETVVLPRKVSRRFRLSRWFYISGWKGWSFIGKKFLRGNRREFYLSYFGPLSLILLLALWAAILILAFTLIQWGFDLPVGAPEKTPTFGSYLYLSGTTFITLGLGDITPQSGLGRFLTVAEAGIGFGFLALIIGYVPIIYQAFSHRETAIALLDARAGSPPSATELLLRHSRDRSNIDLIEFLSSWEGWSSELLESHLSYPVLTYYRSQHERQSWIASLTTILDTCALIIVGIRGIPANKARFIFAIARHAAVDLAQVFRTPPMNPKLNRLSSADFARMCDKLAEVGLHFERPESAQDDLYNLRLIYEPFVNALADNLVINLPPWIPPTKPVDDWQTSAWDHFAQWSPAKIDQITHFLDGHKSRIALHPDQQHQESNAHVSEHGLEQSNSPSSPPAE